MGTGLLPYLGCCINIGVHVSFQINILIFSGYMPKSGTAGPYGGSLFTFLRNLCTISIEAASIYIPINSVRGFPFLHLCSNTCYL